MMTTRDLRRAARARVATAAREDFFAFYRLMFPSLAPGENFIDSPHFQVLTTALQRLEAGDTRRLLISIPPRHGKSIIGSVALPAWALGRRPHTKIICASYGDALSKDFARRSRDLLQSDRFRSVFPDTVLAPGGLALDELRTNAKGYRNATSVLGPVTGKGADLIIVDDPMKAIDASSEPARNDNYNWITGSLMTRFDEPALGRMVVIMQRLHQDDLVGRLLADGGWDIIEMPAEAWREQTFDLGRGREWRFHPGELLFPQRFDAGALSQLKHDLGEAAYSAQILQQPVPPGGALFKLKDIQRYKEVNPHHEMRVQSWDPAVVDNENAAFTVCTTWAIRGPGLYLLHVLRKRLDFPRIAPAILKMREAWKPHKVILETTGAGSGIYQTLMPDAAGWLHYINPKIGKNGRALKQTPKFEAGHIYLPIEAPWLETFEAELAAFPYSKYADQVDSMVNFLSTLDSPNAITMDLKSWPKTLK